MSNVIDEMIDDFLDEVESKNPKFDSPDWNAPNNQWKGKYAVHWYPNSINDTVEIYNLNLLGCLPEDSHWGNVDVLRSFIDMYDLSLKRGYKERIFKVEKVKMIPGGNGWYAIVEAENVFDAHTRFKKAMDKWNKIGFFRALRNT